MENKNKVFSVLIYIFIILLGFGYIWRGNNLFEELGEFLGNIFIQKTTDSKIISSNKTTQQYYSNYRTPKQNYANPYKECSYSRANYESTPNDSYSARYCVNTNTNEITLVFFDESIYKQGVLDKMIKDSGYLIEYTISGNQLIKYTCSENISTGFCNGTSKVSVVAYKRN